MKDAASHGGQKWNGLLGDCFFSTTALKQWKISYEFVGHMLESVVQLVNNSAVTEVIVAHFSVGY